MDIFCCSHTQHPAEDRRGGAGEPEVPRRRRRGTGARARARDGIGSGRVGSIGSDRIESSIGSDRFGSRFGLRSVGSVHGGCGGPTDWWRLAAGLVRVKMRHMAAGRAEDQPTADQPWINHGSTMDQPWINHGSTMDQPWINHEYMDQPWINHGSTMDHRTGDGSTTDQPWITTDQPWITPRGSGDVGHHAWVHGARPPARLSCPHALCAELRQLASATAAPCVPRGVRDSASLPPVQPT